MATHMVKLEVLVQFDDMDGTSEETALLSLDLLEEVLKEHTAIGDMFLSVVEHYEETK